MAPLAAAPLLHPQHGQYQSTVPLAHVYEGRVMDSRWGLGRGLPSVLLNTTSGVPEVPTGGWPLVKVLALFALWASVSTSLRDEDDLEWVAPFEEMEKAKKKRGGKSRAYSSSSSSSSFAAFLFLSGMSGPKSKAIPAPTPTGEGEAVAFGHAWTTKKWMPSSLPPRLSPQPSSSA